MPFYDICCKSVAPSETRYCATRDAGLGNLIPRSWEFLKVIGLFVGFIFLKNLGINIGNYINCSVKVFVFISVVSLIPTFSN